MSTQERDATAGSHAPQVEAPMLGEFMALHAQGNSLAGSSTSSGSSSGQAAHGSDKSSADTSQTPTDLTSKENGVTQEQIANEAYEDASVAPPKKEKKRVRYLRDSERHNIIKRIENGEKQASLAREYGVTRAAICHIKKNREEIVTRYDALIKQAQEIDRAENFTDSPGDEVTVREIRSNSVLLLMTTLRDRRSGPATFRRAAGRLIMLLLEEALAIIGAHAIEMMTAAGHVTYGLERTDEFCGVAIGAEGFPFLVLFHQMEPDAPQGSIHVQQEADRGWRLDHMDLPSDITRFRVLLFSATVSTGGGVCKAIEALCSIGVPEDRITLTAILCSTDGVAAICNRFPGVQIVTGGIDGKVDPQTQMILPGLGDFVSRYNDS